MEWHSHPNCSEFGGPSEDEQGLAGSKKATGAVLTAAQANAKGILYFACCAESPTAKGSSNALLPAELKGLKYGDKLRFRYKGKEAVGIYMDFGPNISTGRYLDLGYPLARLLKFPGRDTVEWALEVEGTPTEEAPVASAAPACKAALAQATARWPKRDKSSDGIMGDAAHQARVSDHNQGNAWDLTEDKAHGVDCGKIILDVIKDPRTRYAIHDRRIWERSTGKWRAYTGSNPHTGHMHVSIVVSMRDNTAPWKGIATGTSTTPPPANTAGSNPLLKEGMAGVAVTRMQKRLSLKGFKVTADGKFGPDTRKHVIEFQKSRKLAADGIVGPATWTALYA